MDGDLAWKDDGEKREALSYILEAWEEALMDGISPDVMATAALFAALSDLVSTYGEEAVGDLVERLAVRTRNGEFSLPRITH